MAALCRDYLHEGPLPAGREADIVIDAAGYRPERWPGLEAGRLAYMESGDRFYRRLVRFGGFLLHASCLVIDGEAYLFSGNCGYGKSTHAGLMREQFGGELINDDKPALREIGGRWIAFGTPWSGKNFQNVNTSAPVKAICFLSRERGRNEIRRLGVVDAVVRLLDGTTNRMAPADMELLLPMLEKVATAVPCFELESLADAESARLAYAAMSGREIPKTEKGEGNE